VPSRLSLLHVSCRSPCEDKSKWHTLLRSSLSAPHEPPFHTHRDLLPLHNSLRPLFQTTALPNTGVGHDGGGDWGERPPRAAPHRPLLARRIQRGAAAAAAAVAVAGARIVALQVLVASS